MASKIMGMAVGNRTKKKEGTKKGTKRLFCNNEVSKETKNRVLQEKEWRDKLGMRETLWPHAHT